MKSKLFLLFAGITFCSLIFWQAAHWSRQTALEQTVELSRNTLNLIAEDLTGHLGKYRYLPQVLSMTQQFRSVLQGDAPMQERQDINEKLEHIKLATGALEIYLMDVNGRVVVASNWELENTFIGRNFADKPYFEATQEGRLGRYFTLDPATGERSYYFAYPVRNRNTIIGATVVKIDIQHHEDKWLSLDHETIVVDRFGIIILSSQPDWHFRSLGSISPEVIAELKQSQRYANKKLEPLTLIGNSHDFRAGAFVTVDYVDPIGTRKKEDFLVNEHTMGPTGWRVILLARTKNVYTLVRTTIVAVAALLLCLFLAAVAVYQHRRKLADHISVQEQANSQLEQKVQERTNALIETNIELQGEIVERKRAEEKVHKTHATLVQTAKLAALGKMSAGMSHELNQPLAAIRTYADNASAYLDRNQAKTTKKNLERISQLTERMARIIKNLRTYARDESTEIRPTSLCSAIDESLVLIDRRIREEEVRIVWKMSDADISVMGGDVRLQQIFINLFSNALDAIKNKEKKEIHIKVSLEGEDWVNVAVSDTGHGMTDEQIASIFDPFYSTKGVGKGMGLGLSITFGLVKQFGGIIDVANAAEGGAVFTLKFKRAQRNKGTVA
ncbi:MAG: ATP-binding protein [Sedimenticola sp.]